MARAQVTIRFALLVITWLAFLGSMAIIPAWWRMRHLWMGRGLIISSVCQSIVLGWLFIEENALALLGAPIVLDVTLRATLLRGVLGLGAWMLVWAAWKQTRDPMGYR